MKQNKGAQHLARNIVLVALLAVICIGGVELIACRHFAPETYERIVAPVRYAATVAADTGKAAANAAIDAGKAAVDATGRFFQAVGDRATELAQQAVIFWKGLTDEPEEIILIVEQPAEPNPTYLPAGDPPLTEVLEADGKQILTGGTVDIVYYCQADEEWAEQLYGTDPIGPYGCGPTAMEIGRAHV